MATTKAKPKKTATTKKANGAAKSAPRKETTKAAKVVAMLKRPNGCTREQVLEATGWKAVSLQQQAAAAGLKLKIDDSERPYRYRAGG